MYGKIALHTLTSYPPSNMNRDEDGRPKTAMYGGSERLRVSSQARKRPWRLSEFVTDLDSERSIRTRRLGLEVLDIFESNGWSGQDAIESAKAIAKVFGNKFGADPKNEEDSGLSKPQKELIHKEIVVYGHEEWQAAIDLAKLLSKNRREPTDDELERLEKRTASLDIALFGRMRASNPQLNVDASVAVSPLLSTHAVAVEADNWTAVDDLSGEGAGGMGETEFASAVMYGYVAINVDSLVHNLADDVDAARASIKALINAVCFVPPAAMWSRFAQDVAPDCYLLETGPSVFSYQSSFTRAVEGQDLSADSIDAMLRHSETMKTQYALAISQWRVSVEQPLPSVVQALIQKVFQ